MHRRLDGGWWCGTVGYGRSDENLTSLIFFLLAKLIAMVFCLLPHTLTTCVTCHMMNLIFICIEIPRSFPPIALCVAIAHCTASRRRGSPRASDVGRAGACRLRSLSVSPVSVLLTMHVQKDACKKRLKLIMDTVHITVWPNYCPHPLN